MGCNFDRQSGHSEPIRAATRRRAPLALTNVPIAIGAFWFGYFLRETRHERALVGGVCRGG
ncbi:hypothetical protein CIT26_33290 [Mesorhizobium temperatum]|uniref:Uncharacterized protein n=1 Tax=Mesorhizobium temperatum TaxID=241416 RepID=A0A271LCD8_9HYPH|nr:hypothetical protein CIT26_33290 [Mesorhizobium temperatum]